MSNQDPSTKPPAPDASDSPPDLLAARAGAHRPQGFFDLPGVRKFMRNRMAVFALGVIAVFFLTAIAIMIPPGLISASSAADVVGPGKLPGFGRQAELAIRDEYATTLTNTVEKAMRSSNPEAALAAIDFAGRTVFSTDPDEVSAQLDLVNNALDAYTDALIEWEDIDDELLDVQSEAEDAGVEPDAAEIERLEQALAEAERLKEEAFEPVADTVEAMIPTPDTIAYKLRLLLGTDNQGRSIFLRGVYSVKTAVQIGFVTSLIAVLLGGLLGAAAGYFGGIIDHIVVWLYSTISAIPYLIWLIVIAFVVREISTPEDWPIFAGVPLGQTLIPVYIAFIMTFWIGPCRVVRGEAMKIKNLDYIQSARSIGASPTRILLQHVVPNTAYLLFINMSLLFVGAIKAEVILSFLGLGVQGLPSWGIMIRDAKDEVITGFFWQIGTATAFMFVLVLAFNIVSDALQDAFDPKHVG